MESKEGVARSPGELQTCPPAGDPSRAQALVGFRRQGNGYRWGGGFNVADGQTSLILSLQYSFRRLNHNHHALISKQAFFLFGEQTTSFIVCVVARPDPTIFPVS